MDLFEPETNSTERTPEDDFGEPQPRDNEDLSARFRFARFEVAITSDQSMKMGRAWYVVHCYSGYENKVRHNLEQRIETHGDERQDL